MRSAGRAEERGHRKYPKGGSGSNANEINKWGTLFMDILLCPIIFKAEDKSGEC